MRVEIIIDLIEHIKKEVDSKRIVSKFDALLELLAMSSNADEKWLANEIEKTKNELIVDLVRIAPPDKSYSKIEVINKIDKIGVVGSRGAQNLASCLIGSNINSPSISKRVKELQNGIVTLSNYDTNTLGLFLENDFSIKGKSLIILIFDGNAKINTVYGIELITKIWNDIINSYSSLVGYSGSEPLLFHVDKSTMIIELPEGDNVIQSISYCLGNFVGTYEKILRIKKLQLEVHGLNLGGDIFFSLESELQGTIEKTIHKIATDLKNLHNISNNGGENIFTSICRSLGHILDFINRGGKIECIAASASKDILNNNILLFETCKLVDQIDIVSKSLECSRVNG